MSDAKVPQNVEAEESLLGSLLLDHDAIVLVHGVVQPTDFYRGRNGQIYGVITELYQKRVPADFITVCDALEKQGVLDDCGGREYITSLLNAVPTATHVEYYAGIVKRHAVARRVIAAAGEIAKIGYQSQESDAAALLAEVEAAFANVSGSVAAQSGFMDGADVIRETMRRQEEYSALLKQKGVGYPDTPWSAVNDLIWAFRPGNLAIVGAATSHGKSLIVECIAEHNARRGHTVLFFHLELDTAEMGQRISYRLGKNIALPNYIVDTVDRAELAEIGQQVYDWRGRVRYCHCPGVKASWLASKIRREAALGRADLVIIDYLNLIDSPNPKLSAQDEEALATNTGIIKTASALAGIPIILVAQLNRKPTDRAASDKAPRLQEQDIRGSGAILQKANLGMLLWNEGVASQDDKINVVDLYITKNTFFGVGKVQLRWNRAHCSFENLHAGGYRAAAETGL